MINNIRVHYNTALLLLIMSYNEKKTDLEQLEVTELLLSDYIRRKEKNILKRVFKQSLKLSFLCS